MSKPHLTPNKLFGSKQLPPKWQLAKSAFICYTSFPQAFEPYIIENAPERYFLHSPNSEVRLGRFKEDYFLVISEVYGFAVGSTTVEELIHYGITKIIGIGYAGAFKGTPMGHPFWVPATMSDLPLAHHYGVEAFESCGPSADFASHLQQLLAEHDHSWSPLTVWNGNSLYREYDETIDLMRDHGCDIVNMDTLSIYAVAPRCTADASYIYVGTITDSSDDSKSEWDSDLIEAVENKETRPHDEVVQFMVESFIPSLKSA